MNIKQSPLWGDGGGEKPSPEGQAHWKNVIGVILYIHTQIA